MVCKNCGKELPEGSNFCPVCGADLTDESQTPAEVQPEDQIETAAPAAEITETAAPAAEITETAAPAAEITETAAPAAEITETAQPQVIFTQPAAEPVPAPRKKKGAIIAIAAVLIIAIAAVVCFAGGVFANPTVTLSKAIAKTIGEFDAIAEKSMLNALNDILTSENHSTTASLGIRSLYDSDTYAGLGLTISTSSDLENEKANLALTPFYGSADIATIGMAAYDHRIFVGSPELLDGKYAGADTLTIGQDLYTQFGVDGFNTVSFNIFDLAEDLNENAVTADKMKEQTEDSLKALAAAITVEKTGKETRTINDVDTEVTVFSVNLPAAETKALINDLRVLFSDSASASDPAELLKKMGFSSDMIMFLLGDYEADAAEVFDTIFNAAEEILDENDGLHYTCYVADGYLRAVEIKNVSDDTDYTVTLEIGSQSMITQTIRCSVTVANGDDETTVVVESTGDHMAATTLYLDTTTVTMTAYGETSEIVCLNTEYDTKTGAFAFKADVPDMDLTMTMNGNLTAAEGVLNMTDCVMTLAQYEETIAELSLDLTCSDKYQDFITVDTNDYYNFATMTEDEWYAVASDLYGDAIDLVYGLDSDLLDLISQFF